MDVLATFLAECCTVAPDATATAKALYAAYVAWCEESGERRPLSQRAFGLRLGESGFTNHKGTGGVRGWLGLGIVAQVADSGATFDISARKSTPREEIPKSAPLAPLAPLDGNEGDEWEEIRL